MKIFVCSIENIPSVLFRAWGMRRPGKWGQTRTRTCLQPTAIRQKGVASSCFQDILMGLFEKYLP